MTVLTCQLKPSANTVQSERQRVTPPLGRQRLVISVNTIVIAILRSVPFVTLTAAPRR